MRFRHPLARAKGAGASGAGSHHWWLQRVSGLALVPLTLWFVFAILGYLDSGHAEARAWIAHPAVAVGLVLYLGFAFYHAQLGLQVILEDYVAGHGVRMVMMMTMKLVMLLGGAVAVFSVLRIAL